MKHECASNPLILSGYQPAGVAWAKEIELHLTLAPRGYRFLKAASRLKGVDQPYR